MLAWELAAKTADEVIRLLRALGKHRYVKEVDHRLHWAIDHALSDLPAFAGHASREPDVDLSSRDPRLWRAATIDEIAAALEAFWTPGPDAERYAARLLEAIASTGLPPAEHDPFGCPPDDPPHPELVMLDWVLLPVDELDADRHAGAILAMAELGEPVSASTPLYQEGPILAASELVAGAKNGVLVGDFVLWSDEPYAYADYVIRGASRAAKLVDPPVGYREL